MNKKIFFSLLVAVAFSAKIDAMNNQNPSKKEFMQSVKTEVRAYQAILQAHANGQNTEGFALALKQFTEEHINPYINKPEHLKAKHYRAKGKGSRTKYFFINTNNVAKKLNFDKN